MREELGAWGKSVNLSVQCNSLQLTGTTDFSTVHEHNPWSVVHG